MISLLESKIDQSRKKLTRRNEKLSRCKWWRYLHKNYKKQHPNDEFEQNSRDGADSYNQSKHKNRWRRWLEGQENNDMTVSITFLVYECAILHPFQTCNSRPLPLRSMWKEERNWKSRRVEISASCAFQMSLRPLCHGWTKKVYYVARPRARHCTEVFAYDCIDLKIIVILLVLILKRLRTLFLG